MEHRLFTAIIDREGLEVAGHLILLSVDLKQTHIVLNRITERLKTEISQIQIDELCHSLNWRMHIVAAWILLLDDQKLYNSNGLWNAIDAGSWVTPQLIVTAYLRSSDFEEQASKRLSKSYPALTSHVFSEEQQRRNNRPKRIKSVLAKRFNSLQAVMGYEKAASILGKEPLDEAIANDIDDCDDIVRVWQARVLQKLHERGIIYNPER